MTELSPVSLIDLADTLGILALVALLYTQVILRSSRSTRLQQHLFLGLLFGAASMLSMMRPVSIAPGVIVDARNVMVALAGPFGGWAAALIATSLAGGYRLWLGGTGALAGTVSVVLAGGAGLVIHHLGRAAQRPSVLACMIVLAALVGITTTVAFLLLPDAVISAVMQSTLVPVVIVNSAGIILLGLFLNHELDRRRIENALARSNAELKIIADNVNDMISVLDEDGFYSYASRSCTQLLGYEPDELIGRNAFELFHPEDVPAIRDASQKLLAGDSEATVLAYRVRRSDGKWTWVETTITLVRPGGSAVEPLIVAVSRDITERQRTMSELRIMANTDALTGVANRRYFNDVGEAEFARWRRYGNPLTLLMLDLDMFKSLNDRLGHVAGDRALRAVAEVLQRECRSVDSVARLGGDEFAVLLPDTTAANSETLVRRVRAGVAEIDPGQTGRGPGLSVSIGIAEATDDIENFHELLAQADTNMYQSKQTERGHAAAIQRSRDAS